MRPYTNFAGISCQQKVFSRTSSVLQCCGNFHGWASHKLILLQVIVARPNSYFLRLWLLTYKDYRPSAWYYNAAEAPTKQILVRRPDLITRVKEKFGVQVFALQSMSLRVQSNNNSGNFLKATTHFMLFTVSALRMPVLCFRIWLTSFTWTQISTGETFTPSTCWPDTGTTWPKKTLSRAKFSTLTRTTFKTTTKVSVKQQGQFGTIPR